MEVGKVGPISAYNTQKRTNSLNFQGRMVDDKIVKEILESIPKKPEGLSAKIIGWLRRSFYFAKSYHVDAQGKSLNLEAFELDSESKIINKDILKMLAERRRPYSVYSYKVLGDGTIPMIHKDIYNKDGIFVRHDFISLSRNDNYETHLFLKDRNKESFARSVRDLDGKLEYVLVDGFSPSSKVVERGKDGSLVRYERKGARLSYDARGRVEGYIDQGKDRFYFMGVDIKDFEARENLSLKSLKSDS